MIYILLDKVSKLENISTVVSIVIILLLAITFGILFYLYYHYYSKCIANKIEDEYLKKEVVQENKKYFNQYQPIVNDSTLSIDEKKEKVVPLKQHINEKKKVRNRIKIVANTFLVVFYLCFVSTMIFAIHVKSSGELFSFFDKSCLIVQTGSMAEKNEKNTYLTENNLDNQIATYSLITIEKVEQKEINLYDIVAFKDNNNRIIVHRIVSITEENGQINYMTRGDANIGSASYELNLTYDDIIGKYNGYQSFALGIIIFYFQSSIGIITLAFGLCLVAFYDVLDIFLGKKINTEKERIYQEIDSDILKAIEDNKKINYVKINEKADKNITEIADEDVIENENDIKDDEENEDVKVKTEENDESETK